MQGHLHAAWMFTLLWGSIVIILATHDREGAPFRIIPGVVLAFSMIWGLPPLVSLFFKNEYSTFFQEFIPAACLFFVYIASGMKWVPRVLIVLVLIASSFFLQYHYFYVRHTGRYVNAASEYAKNKYWHSWLTGLYGAEYPDAKGAILKKVPGKELMRADYERLQFKQ